MTGPTVRMASDERIRERRLDSGVPGAGFGLRDAQMGKHEMGDVSGLSDMGGSDGIICWTGNGQGRGVLTSSRLMSSGFIFLPHHLR